MTSGCCRAGHVLRSRYDGAAEFSRWFASFGRISTQNSCRRLIELCLLQKNHVPRPERWKGWRKPCQRRTFVPELRQG